MKYITAKEQKLSMFSLGTVQLGMNYGIGEDRAKPSEEKALALLDRAMELLAKGIARYQKEMM